MNDELYDCFNAEIEQLQSTIVGLVTLLKEKGILLDGELHVARLRAVAYLDQLAGKDTHVH